MEIYLPVAERSLSLFELLGIGAGVGLLSGLLGVGGGFLLTPLLILLGIPPTVAVASGANQIAASSFSGLLVHWRRRNVDVQMGGILVAGGVIGSFCGVWVFAVLRRLGQIELVISLCYVLLLGTLGVLMMVESLRTYFQRRRKATQRGRLHQHYRLHRLPLKMRFRKSRLYISALTPAGVGFAVGVMTAIMGVGGGFLTIPAMVYLIGMPTAIVVGTSLLQITVVSASVTFLQAVHNHNVDVVLALLLILGGVAGAQFGAAFGARLRGEQLRIIMACVVLLVCAKFAYDLMARPPDPYSLSAVAEPTAGQAARAFADCTRTAGPEVSLFPSCAWAMAGPTTPPGTVTR